MTSHPSPTVRRLQPRWWQWPTVLSLDAPAVAMLWQSLLARLLDQPFGYEPVLVLGLSVWLAYAADRWIEGWRLAPEAFATPRHYFYHRYRWPVAVLWIAALVVDLRVAFTSLATRDLLVGAVLLSAVAAYLLSHQLIHRHHPWRVPKEICIAGLLSGGVGVFLVSSPRFTEALTPLTMFALLCFANCALISVWEQHVDRAHGQTSLVADAPTTVDLIRQVPWGILGIGVLQMAASHHVARTAGACTIASALLLVVIDVAEPNIGPQRARVLADLALMTPALPLLML